MTDHHDGPSSTGAAIVSGLVGGLLTVTMVLSFASLLFSADLIEYLPIGSALFLGAAALMNLVSFRASSLPGSVIVPQDATTAILAGAVAVAIAEVEAGSRLSTALVIVAASGLASAAVMLLLGRLRMGNLIRYLPHPVVGGFLAGTGWLLLAGAADLLTGGYQWSPVGVSSLTAGLLLGLGMVLVMRRGPGVWMFPLVVLGATAAFHLGLVVFGVSLPRARELGLLGSGGDGFSLAAGTFGSVDWGAVVGAGPAIVAVPLVATVALLLNVGGVELVLHRDADLDRELRTVGWANLAGALAAAPSGYHVLSVSSLPFRLGIRSRLVPVVVALTCLMAVLAGPTLVSLLPVPLVGGLLAFLGFSFLFDWVADGWGRMPRSEYFLMLGIVVVVALAGFLAGVVIGLFAAVVLFTVKYSRLDPIRHSFTADRRTSSVERQPGVSAMLSTVRSTIHVVELQGFIFFGTGHRAVTAMRRILDGGGLRCLVVDFRRVEGLDSTATVAFTKLQRSAAGTGVRLVFSHANLQVESALADALPAGSVEFADDLDHALEWCEEVLLAEAVDASGEVPLKRFLADDLWLRLERYMDRITLKSGQVLADVGEASDCLFMVEDGRMAAELPVVGDRWQRVRSVGPGNVLGEFSIYTGAARSARLRAESEVTVLRLSPGAIASLEKSDPACAIAMHRALGRVLADRLTSTHEFVQALVR